MLIALIVVAGLLVYAWIVYPGLMLLLGRRQVQGSGFRVQGEEDCPPVAILFSAHNEEAVILKRLENLAELDYPADRLHVFAGIDGGTDRTAEIAFQWARSHPNVHVIVSPQNHGKTAMLKRLVGESSGVRGQGSGVRVQGSGVRVQGNTESEALPELSSPNSEPCPLTPDSSLLVFTDANTFFAPDGLRRLVAPFSDPEIGGVCGRLVFAGPGNPSPQRHPPSPRLRRASGDTEKSNVAGISPAGPACNACGVATAGRVPAVKIPATLSGGIQREGGGDSTTGLLLPLAVSSFKKPFCEFSGCGTPQTENSQNIGSSSLLCASVPLAQRVVKSAASSGTDEPTYWNLETRLKEAESGLDSCLGANGAIYALRPELFWEAIPDSTIIDDFVLGMKVREQGFRMVFEPAAVATEDLPSTVQDEWRRRVRIGAGAFQALALCRSCLSPRFGVFAWMFWSHKVLRWFTPHLGIGLLVMGCWLWVDSSWSRGRGYWFVAFSAAAIVSLVASPVRKGLKGVAYFLAMQAALFVGFLRYCRGGLKGTWDRTERGEKRGLHH